MYTLGIRDIQLEKNLLIYKIKKYYINQKGKNHGNKS